MRSDLPGKQELPVSLLQAADLVACDSVSQCRIGGELQQLSAGDMPRSPVELPDVILGTAEGRTREEDITICDMTGLGVLATAVSVAAFGRLGLA